MISRSWFIYLGKQDKTVHWLVIGHLLENIYLEECYVREDGKVNKWELTPSEYEGTSPGKT